MARFVKGQSGNPNGRPAGHLNITTRQAREILNKILFTELDNIKSALKEIHEKDKYRYLDIMAKLLQFSIPKKTDVTTDDEPIPAVLNITCASEKGVDELKEFINEPPV